MYKINGEGTTYRTNWLRKGSLMKPGKLKGYNYPKKRAPKG
jgi:hypothetical protein